MQMTLFLPGDTYLYRLDPRAKVLLLIFFTTYIFLPTGLLWQGVLFCFLLIVSLTALGIRQVFSPIRSIWPILLLVLLLTPPFYREDPVGITAMLLLRFTGITYLFSLFFRTTEMSRVIMTLRWYRLPYQAALIITMAIRFIPYLAGVYQQVRDAHRLRGGAGPSSRNPVRKIVSLIPVLTSVMIYAIKAIPTLSMSLEHRGLGSDAYISKTANRNEYKSFVNDRRLFTHFGISVIIAVIFLLAAFIPG